LANGADGYNRHVKLTALLAAVFLLGACSKNIQTNEAVRASVVEYLNGIAAKTGLDMSAMQVDVAKVSFERDEARATIAIRAKSAPGSAPMELTYDLDRKGDKWVVRGAVASAGSPHVDVAPSPSGELPPGHPSAMTNPGTPPAGELPAGHPPVGNKP
jgi:hypothetical protein